MVLYASNVRYYILKRVDESNKNKIENMDKSTIEYQ
jgi:hypothetical protein